MLRRTAKQGKPKIRPPAPFLPNVAGYRYEKGVLIRR